MRAVRVALLEDLPRVVALLYVFALKEYAITNEVLRVSPGPRNSSMEAWQVARFFTEKKRHEATHKWHAHLVKSRVSDGLLYERLAQLLIDLRDVLHDVEAVPAVLTSMREVIKGTGPALVIEGPSVKPSAQFVKDQRTV